MKSIIAAGLLAALATAAAPAKADVIYVITQNSPTYANPAAGPSYPPTVNVTTSMEVVVTDEAAAKGFSIQAGQRGPGDIITPNLEGLIGIYFKSTYSEYDKFDFGLTDFLKKIDPAYYSHYFYLSAAPGGLLSGTVNALNTSFQTNLTLDGTSVVQGRTGLDINLACSPGTCTFTAQQTTTVPEPMSLALFGAGLAGLALARRRKA